MHYIACNSRCHVHVEHTYSYFVNIWLICTWHLVCKRNPRSGKRSDRRPASSHGSTSNFNQRSDKRSNCNKELADDLIDKFQSTLRRTERPRIKTTIDANTDFNPRSGERSDYGYLYQCLTDDDFNPRSGERSDRT